MGWLEAGSGIRWSTPSAVAGLLELGEQYQLGRFYVFGVYVLQGTLMGLLVVAAAEIYDQI